MATFLVMERRSGPEWDPSRPLEQQSGWTAHASYMDELVDRGVIVLGGPLADEHRVVLVVAADSEDAVRATLGRDPWIPSHLRIDTIEPWTIGSMAGAARAVDVRGTINSGPVGGEEQDCSFVLGWSDTPPPPAPRGGSPMPTDPRRLYWDACLNVRDLGGFPTRDGHTTRRRAFVRADNLCRLTAHGRRALARYGVRTAIDLRDPKELVLEHDPFTRDELAEVDRVDIPQLTREFWRAWQGTLTAHEGDLLTLETCREPIATMFAAIAAARDGGVVVYCHAGKERTGLAAALVLDLAGVDRATIAAEHVRSDEHLAPLYAAWLDAEPDPKERQGLRKALRATPDQLELTLAALDELYGGIERYLLESGLEPATIAAVRERIVE